jgi:hypothetical protein
MSDEEKPKPLRDEKGRLLPGQHVPGSGLRKKMPPELRAALMALTPETVVAIKEAMAATTPSGQPDHTVRLRAVQILWERCFGKPHQEISGLDGGPVTIGVDIDLIEMVRKLAGET